MTFDQLTRWQPYLDGDTQGASLEWESCPDGMYVEYAHIKALFEKQVPIAHFIHDEVDGLWRQVQGDFKNDSDVVPLYADPVAPSGHRPTDDALWDQTLQERDNYHEWADKLANAIGLHLGVDIGEHSSANNPWNEALDAIMVSPSRQNLTERQAAALHYLIAAVKSFPGQTLGWQIEEIDGLLRASSATASGNASGSRHE